MTPYPFLQRNLDALEKENPSIHAWLKERLSSLGPSDKLVRNSKGLLDWILPTGKRLFGPLSPWAVYKEWRIPGPSESGVNVVVGSNLGYGINYLLPKLPCGHQMLVLEPSAELLLACLGHTDYRPFLETRKLLFLPPDLRRVRETLSRLVLPCLFGKISLKSDLPSLQLGPEYAAWTGRCKEMLEDLRINVQTVRLHQERMILNELQNLKRAAMEPTPGALGGKARGMAGIVLGAGPSLEKSAPALVPFRERGLIATSFQALPALQAYGLQPHFAMIIDASASLLRVYERLDRQWAKGIPLVYSTTACPEVIEKYPGPTIPIWTRVGLACHAELEKEPVLDVGGNVGVALVRFLRWCGVDRLLLAGQDFSWAGSRTHAENHPAALEDFRFDPRMHIRTKNRAGDVVFTAQPYLTSLRELGRDLEGISIPVYDLYGGGLPIRGSCSIRPEELEARVFEGRAAGGVKEFMEIMRGGLSPAGPPFPEGASSAWTPFFRTAKRRVRKWMGMHSPDRRRVVSFLDEVLRRLQNDPLRKPYLMNEVIDLAGLIYRSADGHSPSLDKCMEIISRAEGKVKDMDRYITGESRPLVRTGMSAETAAA
jgi:hypothetical protein